MKIAPVKTPLVAKKMFPNYIWDIATTNKELYLTFDDGPTPEITNWTLDTLKQYDAKATFFCIGSNIEKHPTIFENIIKDDHAIGNHTQNHIKGWTTKTKNYLKDVKEAQTIINSKTDNLQSSIVTLFRPPYGQIKPKQGRKLIALGHKIIMWDVLSFDWEQDLSEEKCLENVVSKSKAGSIIVFHDSVKASKNMMYTLPKVLEVFSKKGYVFKSLS
ncbi:MAG: peptidoglycan/xylan/chitin deacetylase (PgdA/CDA1 family) [Psychroserpens sp.]|uniref:polysaccharide deacetylase family protein n=1 Tax=Psychroserpens sp. TaxID=2020870 RepID=UPI0039E6B087